jgi:uncharacterized membrane protein YdjX (TVP38/TMEM64 family)
MGKHNADPRRRARPILRTALKIGIPVFCTLASLAMFKLLANRSIFNPNQIAPLLARAGAWGPLVFLLGLTVRPMVLLPSQIFAAIAGMLWGYPMGTGLCSAGSVLSTLVVAFAGRRFLKRPLRRWTGANCGELQRVAKRHDLVFAVLVTMNPLFPSDVCLALAAGSGARVWRLILGALMGSVPATITTALFGSALAGGKPLVLAMSLGGIGLSLAGGAWIGTNLWRALRRGAPGAEQTKRRAFANRESVGAGGPSPLPMAAAQAET